MSLLLAHDAACDGLVWVLLRLAVAVETWRRWVRRRAGRLRASLRRLLRRGRAEAPSGRAAWNRTPAHVEEKLVRLHVELPRLGSGQLRHLAERVLGFHATRETIRRILLRRRDLVVALEQERRRRPRRIHVNGRRQLWGLDLTLVWLLGFWPVWLLGVIDYHGSRVVELRRLRWPTSTATVGALREAFDREGAPERVLTDNGGVFTSEAPRRSSPGAG